MKKVRIDPDSLPPDGAHIRAILPDGTEKSGIYDADARLLLPYPEREAYNDFEFVAEDTQWEPIRNKEG